MPCQQCGKVFETNQSLSLHRLKVHGEHAAVRAFTYTTHCVVCMVEFHTTHRLQMHLRRTRPCVEFSQRYLVPLEPDQFIKVKQGSKFHGHKNVPAIRLAGPRLPTTYEWRESNATDFETGLECASPDAPARPRARVRQPCLKTHEGPADPDSPDWHECASPDAPARPHAQVRQPCLKTREGPADPDSPDWHVSLLDAQHDVDRRTKVDVSNFAFLRHPALLRVRQKPTFFVLHLFSGRDRPGSLRAHVQELNQETDFEVFVICLDVVHDKKLCDLGSPHLVIKLITLAHQGLLLGLQGGPPCETWSCARQQYIGPNAPRPLRSGVQPWALPCLTERELRQIEIGNRLLQNCLLVLLAVFVNVGVEAYCVAQWNWGQSAKKPTTLLTGNLPQFERIINSTQVPVSERPAIGKTTGKDAQEQYNTARLKGIPLSCAVGLP